MSESVQIVLRRVSDGRLRVVERECPDGETEIAWWVHGDGTCDCNRHHEFEKAGGFDPDAIPCGKGEYELVSHRHIRRDLVQTALLTPVGGNELVRLWSQKGAVHD